VRSAPAFLGRILIGFGSTALVGAARQDIIFKPIGLCGSQEREGLFAVCPVPAMACTVVVSG
jgi:hypothetical protein